MGKPICIDHVPHFDVGQDPLQGNLRQSELSGQTINFKKREPEIVLSEVELADMLRTD
jgi:hypothetical protein